MMKKLFASSLCISAAILFSGCNTNPVSIADTASLQKTAVAASLADIVFTSAAIISRTDTQIKYSYTIKNSGTATISDIYNVSIQNFYSSNTVFNDAGDVAAGGRILGVHRSLAPGQSYSGEFYASGTVPAGKVYLIFKIDWGSIISESNENNNTRILPLFADLVFTSAVITSRTATQVKYSYTIKNNSSVAISDIYNVSIQNFYSSNTIFNDAGDVAAGGSIIGIHRALGAGESYSGNYYASGAIPAGKNYLVFKVDWSNIITEMNENNNTRALPLLADLVFTSAVITSRTSTQVKYSYTIKNNGPATIFDIYNVSIQNYYSANTIFNDAGDVAAGGSIIGVHRTLASGQTYSGTFYSSVAVPAGKNYLTFKVDWGNIVAETNENNNTRALSLLADLVFTNVTITSRTSTRVNYSFTIKNIGGNNISSLSNVAIQNYYSANTVFSDAGDVAAGGRILSVSSSLAPNGTYSGTFYASGAVPSGMSYLTVKIDFTNVVSEANENNNTIAKTIP